jgi:hypothetical protein
MDGCYVGKTRPENKKEDRLVSHLSHLILPKTIQEIALFRLVDLGCYIHLDNP